MQIRKLGQQGLHASALGLGCAGMSALYGASDEAECIRTIHRALDLGVTLLDTADTYGPHTNERLVGRAISGRRDSVVLATKFGNVRDPEDPSKRAVNGRPEYVREAIEGSLLRLGVDHVDLFYQHRVDPDTPIEDTVGAMADLVREGKVRYLGLSEAAPETLRRACAVHPISVLQSEFSMWTRDPQGAVLDTCQELGVGFVAYSPLGRGFLTGTIRSPDDLEKGDYRRTTPRFQGANFQKNLDLVAKVQELARDKVCTPAQLALAWVLAQRDDVVAIPGTKKIERLEENLGALDVALDPDELRKISDALPDATGNRYPEFMMSLVDG